MRTSTLTSLAALALGTTAQPYPNQTGPFTLQLISSNSTLNGSTLSACHEGAAIEGLCLSSPIPAGTTPSISQTYTFNYSSTFGSYPAPMGQTGLLTWLLIGGNFQVSSPLQINPGLGSNVAAPLFTPSETGATVGFDEDGKLFVLSTLDDTVVPAVYRAKALYRWVVCQTTFGYAYTTLAWIVGVHSHAQNPSCQKVEVKRVFI